MNAPDTDRLLALLTRIADLLEQRLPVPPDAHLPQECRERRCDYYRHYLAYGPKELEHEGYHAAEALFRRHSDVCRRWEREPCTICMGYEQRLRA